MKLINLKIYLVLTILSYGCLFFFASNSEILLFVPFYVGIVANQLLLARGIHKMTDDLQVSSSGNLIMKFFLLILAFIYAWRYLPDFMLICVVIYIFQLIILVISIKRDTKILRD